MRLHCLQHVPFEGPAALADWASERGHSLAADKTLRWLVEHCGAEIVSGNYVQSVEQMLAVPQVAFDRLHESLYGLLDRLASVDNPV